MAVAETIANAPNDAVRFSVLVELREKRRWRSYCHDEGYLHRETRRREARTEA